MAITLRYLGAAGWHFEHPDGRLLIDPYFTRLPLRQVALGRAIPDAAAIAHHTPPAGHLLVTHAHYDHLMDVPEAARLTGASIYASPQGCALLALLGVPADRLRGIGPGDALACGPFRVTVYRSRHRRIFGRIPYTGPLRPGLRPPLQARDYRMDSLLSFRVEAEGVSVLVASGIEAEPAVQADVLLIGADASPARLGAILAGCRPRLVLPNHWDDMFQPLDRPVRPMIVPPAGLIPTLRRIDLAAFASRVRALSPETAVLIPDRFAGYAIG